MSHTILIQDMISFLIHDFLTLTGVLFKLTIDVKFT